MGSTPPAACIMHVEAGSPRSWGAVHHGPGGHQGDLLSTCQDEHASSTSLSLHNLIYVRTCVCVCVFYVIPGCESFCVRIQANGV